MNFAHSSFFWLLLLVLGAGGCDSGGGDSDPGEDVQPPQTPPAVLERAADYRDWGWETLVLSNGFVRVAAVPAIGGRIMEFSLDGEESIWVNPAQLGRTPAPSPGAWPNHGGYKNWPAPQSRWNWPPPPTLDYGPYQAEVVAENGDSVSVLLESEIEQYRTPGLRFARRITLYRGSTRVRVEQTIVNEGDRDDRWSVWDVTQHIVQHAPAQDFDNFRVYFPINPESRYGSEGVRTDRSSQAWAGPVTTDVYEVRFRPDNAKLFADTRGGWVCYVDLRDGYAYVKTFPVFASEEYPDQGADVEVYVSNQNYVEVEVLSPIATLPANGGSYTFTETWLTARTDGPVLAVNEVGLTNQPLTVNDADLVTGRFGVFHAGLAYVVARDRDGNEVGRSSPLVADPTAPLNVSQRLEGAEAAHRLQLVLVSPSGDEIGVLSSLDR